MDCCDINGRVAVEVPAWTLEDLASVLDVAPWEIERWDLLVADDGRYLADELTHARRLLTLGVAGVSLNAADHLLRRHPDLTLAVERALGVVA